MCRVLIVCASHVFGFFFFPRSICFGWALVFYLTSYLFIYFFVTPAQLIIDRYSLLFKYHINHFEIVNDTNLGRIHQQFIFSIPDLPVCVCVCFCTFCCFYLSCTILKLRNVSSCCFYISKMCHDVFLQLQFSTNESLNKCTSIWMMEIQTHTFSKDSNALLQMHRNLWRQIDAEIGLNRLICYADCTTSSLYEFMYVCVCVFMSTMVNFWLTFQWHKFIIWLCCGKEGLNKWEAVINKCVFL